MPDVSELAQRLADAESRLAYLCGYARSAREMVTSTDTGKTLEALCRVVEIEVTTALPYLKEAE